MPATMISQPTVLMPPVSVRVVSSSTAVATIAATMPPAETRLPFRAVAGEFIRMRPRTKQAADPSQTSLTIVSIVVGSTSALRLVDGLRRGRPAPEHLEHPVGDDVAADDVHRRKRDSDEAEQLAEGVVGLDRDEHRADEDDPVDGVRARHQRRVERRRNLADDGEADEDREDEDRQRVKEFGAHAAPPAVAGAGSSSFLVASWTTSPPWLMTVAFVTSSSKSRLSWPSLTISSSSAEMFRA